MMLMQVVTLVLAAKAVTLEEVKSASRRNLEAIRAEIELAKANANRTVAISGILPRASLQAGTSYTYSGAYRRIFTVQQDVDGGVPQFNQTQIDVAPASYLSMSAGVVVSQVLFDARFWAQLAQSGAQQEAAEGELEEQRLASESEAVTRFYDLLYAIQSRRIFEAAVERSKAQLSRAQSVFAAGKGHQHDILDARVNLGNDHILVLRSDQQIAGARAEVTRWLGLKYEPLDPVPPAILQLKPPMPAPKLEEVLELAQVHRPILKAMASRLRAAQAGVSIARSEYFPTLTAAAQYSREAPTPGLFIDPARQNVVAVGATLSWNFFSGLGTLGRDCSAQAELLLQESVRNQGMVDVEAGIAREYEVLKTSLEIAVMAESVREFAEEETRLAEQRYSVGVGSNLDVRNAQLKLTESQRAALAARIDVETSRAKLGRLAGVPFDQLH